MKKIIYRKFLYDCITFFLITLISTSVIIWVFQAVNYLDIIIDDGRGYVVYLLYSFLNLPKIISKILPFAFFFSFSYVIAKYELNNQLLIFWNFGIEKIKLINFFLIFSIIIFLLQIIFTSLIVPKSQNLAKGLIRDSDFNFFDNFIKVKKFNANIKRLTVYTESKNDEGEYNNIYIKKNINKDEYQIIYAKKGVFKTNINSPILELYDGENTNISNGNITNFSFSKSEFNLGTFSPDIILVKKTQEHDTAELISCFQKLLNKDRQEIEKIKLKVRNCEIKNLDTISSELYKRLLMPLYLPVLMLISLFLIIQSKEKINYSKYRIIIFLVGFAIIIFSETSLRLISNSNIKNIVLVSVPVCLIIFIYLYLILKFKFVKSVR